MFPTALSEIFKTWQHNGCTLLFFRLHQKQLNPLAGEFFFYGFDYCFHHGNMLILDITHENKICLWPGAVSHFVGIFAPPHDCRNNRVKHAGNMFFHERDDFVLYGLICDYFTSSHNKSSIKGNLEKLQFFEITLKTRCFNSCYFQELKLVRNFEKSPKVSFRSSLQLTCLYKNRLPARTRHKSRGEQVQATFCRNLASACFASSSFFFRLPFPHIKVLGFCFYAHFFLSSRASTKQG